MKKSMSKILKPLLVAALLIWVSAPAMAEVLKLRATSYSYKEADAEGNWGEWSEWEASSVLIVINNDRITIYSKVTQEYDVYDGSDFEDDYGGGRSMEMKCVDRNGLRCGIRLRQKDDYWQLYVDYDDAMWVYNVELK